MPSRPTTLDECFQQGTDARQAGHKPADNPYDIDTDEHREWAAGWSATFDLDEDDDPASTRISSQTGEPGENEPEPPANKVR